MFLNKLIGEATWALVRPFSAVWVEDSSIVSLPEELAEIWLGTQGTKASLKLFVRLDLCTGAVQGPELTAGRHSDKRSPLELEEIAVGGLSAGTALLSQAEISGFTPVCLPDACNGSPFSSSSLLASLPSQKHSYS